MPYTLIYVKSAVKDLKKLDAVSKKQIGKKIVVLSKDPLKYARKMIDPKIGTYRWRIGNHRVIFDIVEKQIVVLKIGHRKDIYES
ncbi:type II toxin-antitoxin system RelE/ParE family toxin [candidate division WWE3 bacterium CG_4_10_14_0_2_um_filter_42_7]|uniref:Type II toxin-antitoxin system RelE/ParE family toxin n=2 Tax=Katanobacteria TaxID=422282 RepID=A0A2H0X9S6_UNCKA|nr:MAG: type II toxin-antitoxin system RelE/ParE family toxin [candidate division WWE3 bacterium CG08_land_8_20_14_0_20_41_15]PIZ43537.1 MAG: type II toxin-antitoxin system RelE/ParE family toxin [candidate division WWE3 bacterium CG_4_10_14_0_2_um_filter_42_7]